MLRHSFAVGQSNQGRAPKNSEFIIFQISKKRGTDQCCRVRSLVELLWLNCSHTPSSRAFVINCCIFMLLCENLGVHGVFARWLFDGYQLSYYCSGVLSQL